MDPVRGPGPRRARMVRREPGRAWSPAVELGTDPSPPPEGRPVPSATPAAPDTTTDVVLVVDFGAQYAQLIARRVREARVYSEIVPSTMPVAEMLAKKPEGDHPVRRPVVGVRGGRARLDRALFEAGVPVFGMCYGFQLMATDARRHGRQHRRPRVRPYPLAVSKPGSTLFEGTPAEQSVWMSHGDACSAAPEGFTVTASTDVRPGRRLRERREEAVRRPVPPRGHALHPRPAGAGALPLPGRGHRADLDHHQRRRGAGRRRSASRSATSAPSAACPAAWTPRSPRPSCRRPSATS